MKKIILVFVIFITNTALFSQCGVTLPTNQIICTNNPFAITTTLETGMIATEYKWFKNGSLIVGETNDTLTINSSIETTNTFKVEVNANSCTSPAIDTVTITYIDSSNLLPNSIANLSICDTLNTGFAIFDLTQIEASFIIPNGYTISYYTDAGATDQINNPTSYENTTQLQQTVYVKLQNDTLNTCFDIESFIIEVLNVQATQPYDFNVCDDDFDGFMVFTLPYLDTQVLNGLNPLSYSITYHKTQEDADNNINPLPIFYTNEIIYTELIYIRIENNADSTCYDTTSVALNVKPLPIINYIVDYTQCDDDNITTDGISRVDLSEINEHITTESDTSFVYYTSLQNAIDNTSPISSNAAADYLVNSSVQLFCRAITFFECYQIAEVNITITTSQIPADYMLPNIDPSIANPIILEEFVQCDNIEDDNDDRNGINTFNLGASVTFIRALFPTNQNIIISFFENEDDAILENNIIEDPFHYRNLVPIGQDLTLPVIQNIWVRVDNVLNNECLGLGHHITLTVNPLPEYNVAYDEQICIGETNTLFTNFDNSSGNYSFSWTKEDLVNNTVFLSSEEFIDITTGGTYTVTITNNDTLCSRTETMEISESEKPSLIQLEITSFKNPTNQVIIQVSGIGEYEYALENTIFYPEIGQDNREFQDSKLFDNLNPGEYLITIRDKNLCGETKTKFVILDNKPFFSPNGDDYNQYWTVLGMNLFPESSLMIFDKFGKVLAQIGPNEPGWDGTYNGKIMTDSDYWYVFEYMDSQGVRGSKKGHFTLITVR